MIYPTITQYLESLSSTLNPFCNIGDIEILQDENGEIIFFAGSCSLILQVIYQGRKSTLKLFTEERKDRNIYYKTLQNLKTNNKAPLIPNFHYFEEGIEVYIADFGIGRFPILITEWVEGECLSSRIEHLSYLGRRDELKILTDNFIRFALTLLDANYAHLDLKPENIVIDRESKLTLIDIDAIYFEGSPLNSSIEQGTPWYQHPRRREYHYNKELIEYPIVVILTSLLMLEQNPSLREIFTNGENIIFDPQNLNSAPSPYNLTIEGRIIYDLLFSNSPKVPMLKRNLNIALTIRDNSDKPIDCELFDDYTPFYEGVAAIKLMGLWALTENRCIKSKFIYKEIGRFSEGIIGVVLDNDVILIDRCFNKVATFEGCSGVGVVKFSMVNILKDGKWGVCNINGEWVVDAKFDHIRPFNSSGVASGRVGNKTYTLELKNLNNANSIIIRH